MEQYIKLIYDKKGEINGQLMRQKKPPMFNDCTDGSRRRGILSAPCRSEADLSFFAATLYVVIYEETKGERNGEQKTKVQLGKFAKDPFTLYVAILRHNYAHSQDILFDRKLTIKDVYQKYLGKNDDPKTEEDYQAIQLGLLKDFIAFLEKISDSLISKNLSILNENGKPVKGIIQKDKKGHLYCEKVMLSRIFAPYIGCECQLDYIVNNTYPGIQKKFPYYAFSFTYILVNEEGIIEETDGALHCGNIALPSKMKKYVGKGIRITQIRPNIDRQSVYKVFMKDFEILKNTTFEVKPSIEIGEEYSVEVDEDGNTHVGNVFIGKKKECKKGDIIKVKKIHKEGLRTTVPAKYPFLAADIEIVRTSYGIAKIYTVRKDEESNLHADNMLFSPTAKIALGDRVLVFQVKVNKDKKLQAKYPLLVKSYAVLNSENPLAEEKATEVVNRFIKFLEKGKEGLMWFGSAIVKVILIILGKSNVLKK